MSRKLFPLPARARRYAMGFVYDHDCDPNLGFTATEARGFGNEAACFCRRDAELINSM